MEVRFHPAEGEGDFVELLLRVLVQAGLPGLVEEVLPSEDSADTARAVEACTGEAGI